MAVEYATWDSPGPAGGTIAGLARSRGFTEREAQIAAP